ncbi:DEAD/DEAH box helicase [Nanoarchaeota archaeon]
MLKDFTPRLYQETIFATASMHNTLVVLPTGMGKTAISLLLAAKRLDNFPESKILILAPTRPLVEQHITTFTKHFDLKEEQMALFTGHVKPEKRQELWKTAKVIFSTPQGLENDIISSRINLKEVSLIVFDECHRATGDYAYNFIAKQYVKRAQYPKILGLTASPGSDTEKIFEVCQNLFIDQVEIRDDNDPDVKPYIQDVKLDWVSVELPEKFKQVQKYLKDCCNTKLKDIKELGFDLNRYNLQYKSDLLKAQGMLRAQLANGEKDFNALRAMSVVAEAIKVQHALELLETQGITALNAYFDKLLSESLKTKVKAVQNLVKDINFKSAGVLTRNLFDNDVEHPKFEALKGLLEKEISKASDSKIIVFNQFRDTAVKIVEEINKLPGITANLFVGQAKKKGTGLTQKKQKEMLQEFSSGEFNVLVATSVAEEGLDIPKVDTVIFYEPIPSAIRHIQRRGRTGRNEKGRVIVLLAKNTRDEGYRWSAHHKERRMKHILTTLKNDLTFKFKQENNLQKEQVENHSLKEYLGGESGQSAINIFVDDREKSSNALKELVDFGVNINLKRLEVGDYVLSRRCCVEFKTVPDFIDSIVDGRIMEQIKLLKQNFARPILIIEGTEDIYAQRNIHPNAIKGMLANITVSYGIPILQTKNSKETASILAVIAKREQDETSNNYSLHGSKKPLGLKQEQEYIVSALPGIGPSLAKPLLKGFGSVRKLMNSTEEDLKKIPQLGEKKAKDIQKLLDEEY